MNLITKSFSICFLFQLVLSQEDITKQDIPHIITGPLSFGDILMCIGDNKQIVFSGQLCNGYKRDLGKNSWGDVKSWSVSFMKQVVSDTNEQITECTILPDRYYVVLREEGCMIGTNKKELIPVLTTIVTQNIDNKLIAIDNIIYKSIQSQNISSPQKESDNFSFIIISGFIYVIYIIVKNNY